MGFNVYWAALPFGGCDSLLTVCNCKVLEVWKIQQCTVAEAQSHDKGRGGTTVTAPTTLTTLITTRLLHNPTGLCRHSEQAMFGGTRTANTLERNCDWGHEKTSGHV